MRYLTDRKRAEGRGASGRGTEHHWYMQASAVVLAFMVPWFMYFFGTAIGSSRETVLEIFANPFIAILSALVLTVGMRHFAKGSQIMIEDYWRGTTRKIAIIAVFSLSYVVTAVGLFALARIAL